MLKSLHVENLALVESARVEFQPGFNAITGETGAGKSLLTGALTLALGERADRKIVRSGARQCSVEAVFQLEDAAAVNAVMADCGVAPCSDGLLIMRRVISSSGNRQFVNNCAVTLQTLKGVGDCLADMHGPHEHQSLLYPQAQLDLLDASGRLEDRRVAYAGAYGRYVELARELDELERMPATGVGVEWLEEQEREFSEAGLSETEEQELLAEQKLLGNAHDVIELAGTAEQCLVGDDNSALTALAAALKNLGALESLADIPPTWSEELNSVIARVRETAREFGSLAGRAECDPGQLDQIEQRLALYYKLKRKYGGSVKAALEHYNRVVNELDTARQRDVRLAELTQRREQALNATMDAGARLRAGRQKAADALAKAVRRALNDLEMPHADFAVRLSGIPPGSGGIDSVEFAFCANEGEPLRDLRLAASSGEISRLMLAVKSVLADKDRVPVLVFDEIDVNLGGHAAGVVGRKLSELARYHQVICITHLPQVAAAAAAQIAVRKKTVRKRVFTEVLELDEKGRVEEIARMLGGSAVTDLTIAHAREMLAGS